MGKWLLYFCSLPLLLYFWQHSDSWKPLKKLLKRLRWLFISLFILHLWFHGTDLQWLPSQVGLLIAVEKTAVLIFMVFTAHLLLVTTSISELIGSIQWWFKPFNIIGFNGHKLAVRLALTLETLNHVHELYQQKKHEVKTSHPVAYISQRAAHLFQAVADKAEQATLSQFEISQLSSPPFWQWIYPLSLIIIMVIF